MADQREPPENWRSMDQPLNWQQAGQNAPGGSQPAQHFIAPAESFGPFGPLPDYPDPMPAHELPLTPLPPSPISPVPSASLIKSPGTGAWTYPAYRTYPPLPAPGKAKKPLHFPLTRRAPVLLQSFGMLLYSLIMALGIMGCALTLLRAYVNNGNVYFNLDNSVNGLSVLITCILVLILVPACSIFCGVFFGSWRGLIVSLLSVGGGALISHLTDPRIINVNASPLYYLPFAALPFAALVTGLVYDRRKYAAWWKSMFTMFLGTAALVIWFFVCVYFFDVNADDLSFLAADAHMTVQNYVAYLAFSFGCASLVIIPLLGLLFAAIEGLIHSILAER